MSRWQSSKINKSKSVRNLSKCSIIIIISDFCHTSCRRHFEWLCFINPRFSRKWFRSHVSLKMHFTWAIKYTQCIVHTCISVAYLTRFKTRKQLNSQYNASTAYIYLLMNAKIRISDAPIQGEMKRSDVLGLQRTVLPTILHLIY